MNRELSSMVMNGTEAEATQLGTIRDFMLRAGQRGEWLTLDEIAGTTEFGEASVSAQLRHLRKAQHGRYRVEKRRRQSNASQAAFETCLWEYQVLPPVGAMLPPTAAKPRGEEPAMQRASRSSMANMQRGETRDAEARS